AIPVAYDYPAAERCRNGPCQQKWTKHDSCARCAAAFYSLHEERNIRGDTEHKHTQHNPTNTGNTDDAVVEKRQRQNWISSAALFAQEQANEHSKQGKQTKTWQRVPCPARSTLEQGEKQGYNCARKCQRSNVIQVLLLAFDIFL